VEVTMSVARNIISALLVFIFILLTYD